MVEISVHDLGGDALAMSPGRGSIPETVLELWHQYGVSTEHVERCEASEQRALKPTVQPAAPLPASVRRYALQCMAVIMQNEKMGQVEWFQAVSLLDCYFLKAADSPPMLPVSCLCVVRLIRKLNGRRSSIDFLASARKMAQDLTMAGIEAPDITEEVFDHHEWVISDALNWQFDVMTVERWVSMFSFRLNTLDRDSCQQISGEAVIYMAHTVVMHRSASLEFSHRNLALGVFSLSLVMAHLIPFGVLSPPASAPSGTDAASVQSKLMSRQLFRMIGSLEAVTCCELHVLQQATQSVMQALPAVVRQRLMAV